MDRSARPVSWAKGFDPVCEAPARGAVVDGGDDPGPLPHLFDSRADQGRQARRHRPVGAGVAGVLVRMRGGIGQGVDAALGDHQGAIPCPAAIPHARSAAQKYPPCRPSLRCARGPKGAVTG